MNKINQNLNIGMLIIGIFIISWGIVWLGNEMGWWNIVFPFWPFVVILVGVAILIHELRRSVK